MLNKTKRRYTEQLSLERVDKAIQDYNDGLSGVQLYDIKEGVFIGGASPVFKVETFTNTIPDFVNAIGEIAIQFGKLEMQQYGSGYESTIAQHIHGYRKAVLYYKKSRDMQEVDKDSLIKLVDADLRKEIEVHNQALEQGAIDEVQAKNDRLTQLKAEKLKRELDEQELSNLEVELG